MLDLHGKRLRPARFVGADAGGTRVELLMPTAMLFGGRPGRIKVDGSSYEIRSQANRLWLLDELDGVRGFSERDGLRTSMTFGNFELEIIRAKSSDRLARVHRGDAVAGAVNGNGRGGRSIRVDVNGLTDLVGQAFVGAVVIASWRDLLSMFAYDTTGTPLVGSSGGGDGGWQDNPPDCSIDSGGGFWDGFGGGDGGGGGGDGGGGG